MEYVIGKRKERKKKTLIRISISITIALLILGILWTFDKFTEAYVQLNSDYIMSLSELKSDYDAKYNDILEINTEYKNTIQKQEIVSGKLKEAIQEQDKQIKNIIDINQSNIEELNLLRQRNDLLNKYEYVIFNDIGERTELTYDQIKTGEQLMEEKGLDPNLLFATIAVESSSNPNAYNPSGSAGLGQFIPNTGKFVYETLLGNGSGTYDHSVTPYIPDTAIEMIVSYYDYLFDKYNNDTYASIKHYCGGDDYNTSIYISRLNNFSSQCGYYIY